MQAGIAQAIAQLREANEPVPKPMRLPTEGEVVAAEQALGRTFQPEYRRFLLEASDVVLGTLEPGTVTSPGSYTDLVPMVVAAREHMGVPEELLPYCEDNGDYFCLKGDGAVVFWSHNGTTDEEWPSLADWILTEWIANA